MPVPVAAKAGIIVASVAVAAAIAIYESPEVRRVADDLRRRIAVALHSLGDNFDPNQERSPRFNRPEDAEGFLESRGGTGEVEADEETRRRQREELMYWNLQREERERQKAAQQQQQQQQQQSPSRVLTFDDFLREDNSAPERGTFVYNTGATPSPWTDSQNLLRRRGDGVRGLNATMIANPFADEYGIELNEHPAGGNQEQEQHALSPGRDEIMSDIYEATPAQSKATLSPQSKPVVPEVLFDFDSHTRSETVDTATADSSRSEAATGSSMERELADDEFMTAGQERDSDAYTSIQAWAEGSTGNMGFYSPLPETPVAPVSEPEMISEGALTPAYSASVVDVADEVESRGGRDFDVLSEDSDDDGLATPASWSEVGSVVSENDSERGDRVGA